MSLLRALLEGRTTWLDDRGQETPGGFAPPAREAEILAQGAGLVDLSHRGVVAVAGADRLALLSGLITNQIRKVTPQQAVYALLLTPQGRYLWDFTILEGEGGFLLLAEPGRVDDLARRLAMYVLRSKATVNAVSAEFGELALVGAGAEQAVTALFPDLPTTDAPPGRAWPLEAGAALWKDPRHPAFGWRLLAPTATLAAWWQRLAAVATPVGFPAWEAWRVGHGLPRGGAELLPDQTLPLEAGMVEMNAIDFGKGCYVGQETTARTNYRGTIKHRLFQWELPAAAPVGAGEALLTHSGKEAGHVTSLTAVGEGVAGLAMLRVSDALDHELTLAGHPLRPRKPAWAVWE